MQPKNDYLLLIWKDPETRQNYTVGKLTRGKGFTFQYWGDAAKAEAAGWKLLGAFPTYRVYSSDTMFPVFCSRLPDRKRRDIQNILKKYGLEKFDEYELLRRSGARLPIDTYEFVDPIFPENKEVEREFYIMGIRHNSPCNGVDCEGLPRLNAGDLLVLEEEPENEHDPSAIRVMTPNGEHLGYVPRYYNKAILERFQEGMSYSCRVIEVNKQRCSECVKVKLNMPGV